MGGKIENFIYMPRYQIPQFIDIEDKILGPLTIRQFFYFLAAAAIGFILWNFLTFQYFIIAMTIVGGLSVMFAFVKINGKPFNAFFYSLIGFIFSSQKYIWKKENFITAPEEIHQEKKQEKYITKTMPEQQIKKLSSLLDIKENNINNNL